MKSKISSWMLVLALGFGTAALVRAADAKDVKKDAATATQTGKKKHTRKHKSAKAATPAAPATPATPGK